jgi:hypothetical protein
MPPPPKRTIREFLLNHLVPQLEDRDWLLYRGDTLLKVKDEILLGLACDRSGTGSAILRVMIRPLYWPAPAGAFGIMEPIGRWFSKKDRMGQGWMDLDGPEQAEEQARKFSPVINTRITPFFAALVDGPAVLRYERTHFTDPILSCNPFVAGPRPNTEILGYIAAWSGEKRQARSWLKAVLSRRGEGDTRRIEEEELHIQETLRLLDQPQQLREFLQETADRMRAEMKLERARPIAMENSLS